MGANIRQLFPFPKANLESAPVGKIKVGSMSIGLAQTKLTDIAKTFGGTIRSGDGAPWVCYHTEGRPAIAGSSPMLWAARNS